MRARVVAVCGLAVEARIAAGDGVVTVAGGGRSAELAIAIEACIAARAQPLLSFGMARALDAALRPGTLVVADAVISGDDRYGTDDRWSLSLREATGAVSGVIAAGDAMVVDAAAKRRLRVTTGAVAVDMESQVVARIARRHALPFAVFRAIADPAERSLPSAATVAMKPGGGIDLAAVLGSIARSPRQLPQLIAIGLDTRRALRALGRGRRLLGGGLGHADLDQLRVDVI